MKISEQRLIRFARVISAMHRVTKASSDLTSSTPTFGGSILAVNIQNMMNELVAALEEE